MSLRAAQDVRGVVAGMVGGAATAVRMHCLASLCRSLVLHKSGTPPGAPHTLRLFRRDELTDVEYFMPPLCPVRAGSPL